MGRFPKHTLKRVDLLSHWDKLPIGAFVKDGTIFPGWQWETIRNAAVFKNLGAMRWSDAANGVLAGTSDGKIYYGPLGTDMKQIYSDGGNSPFIFETYEGREKTVIVSGSCYTEISDGTQLHSVFPRELSNAVVRKGRLFGVDAGMPYTLRWSGPGGFTDWNEGIAGAGSLALTPTGGQIIDLFDFEDELVVFRERSIMRFSAYGDPENFREKAVLDVPGIFRKSAAIAGDSILFFSQGGLMRYRGGKVTRVESVISDDLTSPVLCTFCDGRYYFLCGMSKSLKVSVIYVYDFICDCFEIVEKPAYFMSQDSNSILAYSSYAVERLRLDSGSIRYAISTQSLDFGTDKIKIATLLEVDCGDDVNVTISNGRYLTEYKDVKGRIKLHLRGDSFKVTFSGLSSVKSAYLTVEVIE